MPNDTVYPPFDVGSRVVVITSHPRGGLGGVVMGTEVGTIMRIDDSEGYSASHVIVDFPNCHHWGGTTLEIGYPGADITEKLRKEEEDGAFDILFSFLEAIVEDNGHKIVKKLMSKRDRNIIVKYARKIRELKR